MQNKALPVRIEGPIKVDAEVKAIMVGDNGKSAYEIAVDHGYKGTEQEWLDSLKGLQGPQGDSVNAEVVAKIKNFLLDNNVVIHSDSLEGIMLEHFKILKTGGAVFITDDELSQLEPSLNIDGNQLDIYYIGNLPFSINDGELQNVAHGLKKIDLTAYSKPITVKFYNARMKLMFTKTVEVG